VLESNFHIWYQQLVHHLTSVLPTYNNHISRGKFLTRIVMPYIILLNLLRTTSSSTFMSISRIPPTELLCLKVSRLRSLVLLINYYYYDEDDYGTLV
jgi:hypothetical protein